MEMECSKANQVEVLSENLSGSVLHSVAKEQLLMLLTQLKIRHLPSQAGIHLYDLRLVVESTFASNKTLGPYVASWDVFLTLLQELEEETDWIWTDVKGIVHLSPCNKKPEEPQNVLAQQVSEKKGVIGLQGYVIKIVALARVGYAYVSCPLRCIVEFNLSKDEIEIKEGDLLYLKIHDNPGRFFLAEDFYKCSQIIVQPELDSEVRTTKNQKMLAVCGKVMNVNKNFCTIIKKKTEIVCNLKYTQVFVNGWQVWDLRCHIREGNDVHFDAFFDTKWKASTVWVGTKPKRQNSSQEDLCNYDQTENYSDRKSNESSSDYSTENLDSIRVYDTAEQLNSGNLNSTDILNVSTEEGKNDNIKEETSYSDLTNSEHEPSSHDIQSITTNINTCNTLFHQENNPASIREGNSTENSSDCYAQNNDSNMMLNNKSSENVYTYTFVGISGRVTNVDRKKCTIVKKTTRILCSLEFTKVFVNGLKVADMDLYFNEGCCVCFDAFFDTEWKASVVWVGKKPKHENQTEEHLNDSVQQQKYVDRQSKDNSTVDHASIAEVRENEHDSLVTALDNTEEHLPDPYELIDESDIMSTDSSNSRSIVTDGNAFTENDTLDDSVSNDSDGLKEETTFWNNSSDFTHYKNGPRHDALMIRTGNIRAIARSEYVPTNEGTKQQLSGVCGRVILVKKIGCVIFKNKTLVFCFLKYAQVSVHGLLVTDMRLHFKEGSCVYFDAFFDTEWIATAVWVGKKPKNQNRPPVHSKDSDEIQNCLERKSGKDLTQNSVLNRASIIEVRTDKHIAVAVDATDEHLSSSYQTNARSDMTSSDSLNNRTTDYVNAFVCNGIVEGSVDFGLHDLQKEENLQNNSSDFMHNGKVPINDVQDAKRDNSTVAQPEAKTVLTMSQVFTAECGIVRNLNKDSGIIMKKEIKIHFDLRYTAVYFNGLLITIAALHRYLKNGSDVSFDAIFDGVWKAKLLWKGKKPQHLQDLNKPLNVCNQRENDLEKMASESLMKSSGNIDGPSSNENICSCIVIDDIEEVTSCKNSSSELTNYDKEHTNNIELLTNNNNIDAQAEDTNVPSATQEFISECGIIRNVNQNSGTIMKKEIEVHFDINYTAVYVNGSQVEDFVLFLKEGSSVCFDALFDTTWKATLVWVGKKPKDRNIEQDSESARLTNTGSSGGNSEKHVSIASDTDTVLEYSKDEETCKDDIFETSHVSEIDLAFLHIHDDELKPKVPRYFFYDKRIIDLVSMPNVSLLDKVHLPEKDSSVSNLSIQDTRNYEFSTNIQENPIIRLCPPEKASTVCVYPKQNDKPIFEAIESNVLLSSDETKSNKVSSQVTEIVPIQLSEEETFPELSLTVDLTDAPDSDAKRDSPSLHTPEKALKLSDDGLDDFNDEQRNNEPSFPASENLAQLSQSESKASDSSAEEAKGDDELNQIETKIVQPPVTASTRNCTKFYVLRKNTCTCASTCTFMDNGDKQAALPEGGMALDNQKVYYTTSANFVEPEKENTHGLLSEADNTLDSARFNTTMSYAKDVGCFSYVDPELLMQYGKNETVSVRNATSNKHTKDLEMDKSLPNEFHIKNGKMYQEEQVRLHKMIMRCEVSCPCALLQVQSAFNARSRRKTSARELQLDPEDDLDFVVDLVLDHLLSQRERIKSRCRFIVQRKSKVGIRGKATKKSRREKTPRNAHFKSEPSNFENVQCFRLVLCFVFFSVCFHWQIFSTCL